MEVPWRREPLKEEGMEGWGVAQRMGALEGEGSCRVLLFKCRVGVGVNGVVANYRDGRGFGGGASSSRPPALAFPAAVQGLWAEAAATPCCVWLRSHPPQRPHSDASAA